MLIFNLPNKMSSLFVLMRRCGVERIELYMEHFSEREVLMRRCGVESFGGLLFCVLKS